MVGTIKRERAARGTSAGLVSAAAAAGGQTGCPDSTEGRLLCLPRVARGRLEPPPLRPYLAKRDREARGVRQPNERKTHCTYSNGERGNGSDTCTHTREPVFTREFRASILAARVWVSSCPPSSLYAARCFSPRLRLCFSLARTRQPADSLSRDPLELERSNYRWVMSNVLVYSFKHVDKGMCRRFKCSDDALASSFVEDPRFRYRALK